MNYNVYFAGDLFDHKHLTGNYFLSKKIYGLSKKTFKCKLPQDYEMELDNEIDIRNADIKSVLNSDLVLLNFDGVDLDSGTVVEFMIAKMLDIPVVLLRTDYRNGGHGFNSSWNLMASGYPRSVTLISPVYNEYNKLGLEKMHNNLAKSIIDSLNKALEKVSILKSYDEILFAYKHVVKICGSNLNKIIADKDLIKIIENKINKNIYNLTTSFNRGIVKNLSI